MQPYGAKGIHGCVFGQLLEPYSRQVVHHQGCVHTASYVLHVRHQLRQHGMPRPDPATLEAIKAVYLDPAVGLLLSKQRLKQKLKALGVKFTASCRPRSFLCQQLTRLPIRFQLPKRGENFRIAAPAGVFRIDIMYIFSNLKRYNKGAVRSRVKGPVTCALGYSTCDATEQCRMP